MVIECNQINPYYVYRHRRLDTFEIFYVGISKIKNRCRNRSTRNKIWKDIINKTKYSVEIIQENLSHSDACELEIFLVQSYGRINLKTGIIYNSATEIATIPYFAYNFSTLTNNNTVTACGYAFGLTLYSADNLLDVGSILYTDTELTSVFVGDNLYHSLQTAGTNKYVRINTVGVVIIIGDC